MISAKTVMITGSSSGIGLALYHEYLSLGYQVIACGRNREKLNQVNPDATTKLVFDVTNPNAVLAAAQQVDELDILILNAGTCQYIDDAKHFNGQAFREVIGTNLLSMGALLEGFLPKVAQGGQLALISSSATIIPFPRAQAYGASKAGLDYLANSLRVDLKPAGISVSLIHPGFVKTPLTDRNDFPMLFILTPKQAGERIVQGLIQRKNYVHFPKRLTWLLKLLALFPQSLSSTLLTKES